MFTIIDKFTLLFGSFHLSFHLLIHPKQLLDDPKILLHLIPHINAKECFEMQDFSSFYFWGWWFRVFFNFKKPTWCLIFAVSKIHFYCRIWVTLLPWRNWTTFGLTVAKKDEKQQINFKIVLSRIRCRAGLG